MNNRKNLDKWTQLYRISLIKIEFINFLSQQEYLILKGIIIIHLIIREKIID